MILMKIWSIFLLEVTGYYHYTVIIQLTNSEKNKMNNYYENVKDLTLDAHSHIEYELEGNYKGYTGANAVSLYMNDEHNINVGACNTAERAFKDALEIING